MPTKDGGPAKPEVITEESGVHKQWLARAAEAKTLRDVSALFRELEAARLDYGTCVHATTAVALAAANAMARHAGITGFQAGCVMWGFIDGWSPDAEGPKRIVYYEHLLYPQYAAQFEKTITAETWGWLQQRARDLLAREDVAAESVKAHWKAISDGAVPFGFAVRES